MDGSIPASRRQFQTLPSATLSNSTPGTTCAAIFEEICVNSNGDIACSCADADGRRVYGNVARDRIADVYDNIFYEEMRQWHLASEPGSWCPGTCEHCSKKDLPATDKLVTEPRKIRMLQLESTSHCNIECPLCPVTTTFEDDEVLREVRGRKMMSLEMMIDVVDQLPDLERILYYNYGEPFLNPNTIAFLRYVREKHPNVWVVTSTNGIVMTPKQIEALAKEALMDQVIFSIDGADQESYARYRVGGNLSKAMKKMKALVDQCREAGTLDRVDVVWQYILFEWNDSDEEIKRAIDIAREIGVRHRWVLSSGPGASKRYVGEDTPATVGLAGSDVSGVTSNIRAALRDSLGEEDALPVDVYQRVRGHCALNSIKPTAEQARAYDARLTISKDAFELPRGAKTLFEFEISNRSGQSWEADGADCLRLATLLKTPQADAMREMQGAFLPVEAVRPGGTGTVSFVIDLPREPGRYELMIDVVHETVAWFHERGSQPLRVPIEIL